MAAFTDSISPETIKDLVAGKQAAFGLIYNCYFDPLYKSVYHVVKDEDLTQEILQEVFLKLWIKHRSINPEKSLKAYLLKIAMNKIYDHYRKEARAQRLTQEEITFYSEKPGLEEMLEKKEEYKLLNQAVDRLSPQRKLVFIYCKIDGNTYEQASNALGISVATVNTHMSHSIRLIKEFMLDSYHSCPS